MAQIKRFKGLNNVSDPLRLGLGWLAQADNVDVSDTGGLVKRDGYAKKLAASAITGAYATRDFSRMYLVDGGALKAMTGLTSALTLATGLAAAPMHFTEINDYVYYNNGVDRGVIAPDNALLDWEWVEPTVPTLSAISGSLPAGTYQVRCIFQLADGRTTGSSDPASINLGEGQALSISSIDQRAGLKTRVYIAPANSEVFQLAETNAPVAMTWNASPDALGADLLTTFFDPLPRGADVIQAWRGRIFAAQYFPELDQTAVWSSQPLGFHLFNLNEDYFLAPGRVLMLAPTNDALIVGTGSRLYAYDGEKLPQIAEYGVVPGWHWSFEDDNTVLFWTTRGMCAALPFTNLTERQVSVPPGVQAGGAVVRSGGRKRYLVALHQGGVAFNPRSTIS